MHFSNVLILLFLLFVFSLLWIQNSARVVDNPRKYPYQFKSCEIDSTIGKPAYIQSSKFSDDTNRSLLLFNQEQNCYNLSILNSNCEREYSRNIGSCENIKDIGFIDVNNDGVEELLLTITFPVTSETDTVSSINNTHIWIRDRNDLITTLDRFAPPDILVDTSDLDRNYLFCINARVIYETDHVTPSSSGKYFSIGVWGNGVARTNRWVFIYQAGNPPKRIAQIKTPFYPTNGVWHKLADGKVAFTVTGSSYKYGCKDPLKWDEEPSWAFEDFVDGINDAVIQIDENSDILWTLQLNAKIGETGIYADTDSTKPLIAFYHQDLFQSGDARERVNILKIDRSTGVVIDSTVISGKFLTFTGFAAKECEYLGIRVNPDQSGQLLRKDGNLEDKFNFHYNDNLSTCPVMKIDEGHYGIITSFNEALLLYGFNGDILAVTNGSSYIVSLRHELNGVLEDVLPVICNNRFDLIKITGSNWYWWLFRWQWLLLVLVISPFPFIINMRIRNANQRSHDILMNYFNEMEDLVEERTDELKKANELLANEIEIRKTAEAALENSHRHLEAIFNSVNDGLLSLNKEMIITNSNNALIKIFNTKRESLIGINLNEVFKDGVELINEAVNKVINTGESVYYPQIEIISFEDIKRITQISAIPLSDNFSNNVLLVIRDVTQLYTLKDQMFGEKRFRNIVGASAPMKKLFHLITEISGSNTTVLITGESGTGKELVAHAIHFNSPRSDGPFIAVNCAALSENLLESELFGHVKGAFTGALKDRKGLFESAQDGTIFLDEIGDITLPMQAKLLRVLQEGEFARVGETQIRKTNARIITATNKDLQKKIKDNLFRQDLYFRLNVFSIHLPPLRDRKEDIPILIDHFRKEFNELLSRNVERISDVAMERLINYEWHGNIRELKNIINGAMILCHEEVLEPRHFHPEFFNKEIFNSDNSKLNIVKNDELQIITNNQLDQQLIETLKSNYWNVSKVSQLLGVSRTHIYNKMKELGIKRPK
ncbi:sigma 54-interacting transcriptional regulator [bacterium]|nr:sigma 54-interacting transcriptional regulator [bacterium]